MTAPLTPVYLWRAGNPPHWASAFFESYRLHAPEARLVVLLKGFGDAPPLPADTEPFRVDDTGFDLTAYWKLAEARPDGAFLFLNSHSRILAPGWLGHLSEAFAETGGQGLVGASGSWEATGAVPDFPNPHIRTNAFAVSARDYLEASPEPPLTRTACLELEAGPRSLTRHFLDRDRPVLVIDANGRRWPVADWPKSQTFRLGDQEGLLVADNRSQKYRLGTARRRRHHARASWGDAATVSPLPTRRWLTRLIWERVLHFGHRPRLLARLLGKAGP